MTQWGNEQVPSDVYNAAVNAGQKYGKDSTQAKQITDTLLGIGKYESTWNATARNESAIENSYGWLQFNRGKNGSTGFGTGYEIEQLFIPQVEADIAAEHIARNLNSGVSLFDSLWPWTNTRTSGLALAAQVNTTLDGVTGPVGPTGPSGPNTKDVTGAPPVAGSGLIGIIGGLFDPNRTGRVATKTISPGQAGAVALSKVPNPLTGVDAIGKFMADLENNGKKLGVTAIAFVLIGAGLFVMVKGVTKQHA